MTEKPKLEIVPDTTESRINSDPTSIFDDLEALKKARKETPTKKTLVINIGVDRPAGDTFFRASSEFALDEETVVRQREGKERGYYYVTPTMAKHPRLTRLCRVVTLGLMCVRPGNVWQFWPVPVVGESTNKILKSQRAAYERSLEHWMSLTWGDEASDFKVDLAEGLTDVEPIWPEGKTLNELLKIAFAGRIIDNDEHPYVRRLRGLD